MEHRIDIWRKFISNVTNKESCELVTSVTISDSEIEEYALQKHFDYYDVKDSENYSARIDKTIID